MFPNRYHELMTSPILPCSSRMSSRFAFLDIHSLAWFGKGKSSVLKKKQHVLFFDPIPLEKDHATNERITLSNFSIFLKIGLILSRQWGPP
jgi:hypothetical protein